MLSNSRQTNSRQMPVLLAASEGNVVRVCQSRLRSRASHRAKSWRLRFRQYQPTRRCAFVLPGWNRRLVGLVGDRASAAQRQLLIVQLMSGGKRTVRQPAPAAHRRAFQKFPTYKNERRTLSCGVRRLRILLRCEGQRIYAGAIQLQNVVQPGNQIIIVEIAKRYAVSRVRIECLQARGRSTVHELNDHCDGQY
jgi:hypothetical protein